MLLCPFRTLYMEWNSLYKMMFCRGEERVIGHRFGPSGNLIFDRFSTFLDRFTGGTKITKIVKKGLFSRKRVFKT